MKDKKDYCLTCNGNEAEYDKYDVYQFWVGAVCAIAPFILLIAMVG